VPVWLFAPCSSHGLGGVAAGPAAAELQSNALLRPSRRTASDRCQTSFQLGSDALRVRRGLSTAVHAGPRPQLAAVLALPRSTTVNERQEKAVLAALVGSSAPVLDVLQRTD
jgi:hypothetical protein